MNKLIACKMFRSIHFNEQYLYILLDKFPPFWIRFLFSMNLCSNIKITFDREIPFSNQPGMVLSLVWINLVWFSNSINYLTAFWSISSSPQSCASWTFLNYEFPNGMKDFNGFEYGTVICKSNVMIQIIRSWMIIKYTFPFSIYQWNLNISRTHVLNCAVDSVRVYVMSTYFLFFVHC